MKTISSYKSISVLLFVVLTAFAILFGLSACGREESEPVPSGTEKGTYYCEVGEEEYLINLADGPIAKFSFGDDVREGAYSFDGMQFTFNFDGETLTAKYEDEEITLTYESEELTFIRRVNYTVTFETNGGSEVKVVSVLNGKTIEKPDDPTRTNYKFIGWRADEDSDALFDFENTVISGNITLYAKWEYIPQKNVITLPDGSKVTVTEGENYSLGVPSTVEEGYEFIGWVTDDGTWLTDNLGNSLSGWDISLGDVSVSAKTEVVLTYELTSDGNGYAVSGSEISKSLKELTIPASYEGKPVTEVYGFSEYTELISVSLPDTVQTMDISAFMYCGKLASYEVYDANSSLTAAFCSENGVLFSTDMHTLVGYPVAKTDEKYIIPASVLEIAPYAFSDIAPDYIWLDSTVGVLKSVVLPKNLQTIGDHAFYYRKNLENVSFSGEGTMEWSVGDYAFYSAGIKQFPFNARLTSIGEYAFAGNIMFSPKLTEITFPEKCILHTIGKNAFEYCTKLQSVEFPASLVELGEYVLSNSRVKTVVFAEGSVLQKIPAHAFDASGVISATFPDSITQIGEGAFSGCQTLREVEFPSKLTEIGSSAFTKTLGLKQIVFPQSLKKIGESAFASSGLTTVDFNEGLEYIGKNAFASTELVKVKLPPSVTEIAEGAFMDCDELIEVILSEGLKKIGKNAFYAPKPATGQSPSAALVFVNIPSTVTQFGEDIFSEYKQIKKIIVDNAAFLKYLPSCEGFSVIISIEVGEDITVPDEISDVFVKGESAEGYTLYTKKD